MNTALARRVLAHCGGAALIVAAVTALALLLRTVTGYWAISLIYLLTVVLLALRFNRWAVLMAAAMSAVLWNFLFIPPRFTFHIESAEDMLMFGMYFVVALVMGHLTNQLRRREEAERQREQRTAALNRLLQHLAASASLEDGLARAVGEVDALFGSRTTMILDDTPTAEDELVLPLRTATEHLGALVVRLPVGRILTPNERELLETFASQVAVFIERHRLMASAQRAQLAEESERLHRTVLDSVSHELKTPLAVIRAATDGLEPQLTDVPLGRTFLEEIQAANRRLNRIVGNLLEIARIEAGRLTLNLEWGDARELLESAADQVRNEISRGRIEIVAPADLPSVRLDFRLIEQALCNLLLNAVAHSRADTPIRMSAEVNQGTLVLQVSDRGTGLAPGEEEKVFGKFYRGAGANPGGTGLGLSIVAGIVRAHHGEVSAANNVDGGATFTIRVPA